MAYKIFTTEEFDRLFRKISEPAKTKIKKKIDNLQTNPYLSKPLGYRFFREKKIGKYRIYFLVCDERSAVFLISASKKKDQQKAIDSIKKLMSYYKQIIKQK